MLARRLLILFAVMLMASALATAISPRSSREGDDSPTVPAPALPAASGPAPREVEATLPSGKPVRVATGDLVTLRVRADEEDQAEITGLGLSEPVGSDLPAELMFVADEPGRYPVTLSLAGREVGVVEVRGAGA